MTSSPPRLDEAAKHYAAFLRALGIGDDAEGCARRVSELFAAWSRAAQPDSRLPSLSLFKAPEDADWVVLKRLPFYAFCEHHMVPFFGHVDVAYRPARTIVGFSSVPRLLEHLCRKPQLQEGLTTEFADTLALGLAPHALVVRSTARQLCMELRGHPHPTPCVSLATRGSDEPAAIRAEALELFRD